MSIMRQMYGPDYLKMIHGPDAVEAPAKFYIQDAGEHRGIPKHLIVGVVVGDLGIPTKEGRAPYRHGEMWSGRIVLNPDERYRDIHDYYAGYGITGIVTASFGDPDNYGLKVK